MRNALLLLVLVLITQGCLMFYKDPNLKTTIFENRNFANSHTEDKPGLLIILQDEKIKEEDLLKIREKFNSWSGFYKNSNLRFINIVRKDDFPLDKITKKNLIQIRIELSDNYALMIHSILSLGVIPGYWTEEARISEVALYDNSGMQRIIFIPDAPESKEIYMWFGWVFLPIGIPLQYFDESRFKPEEVSILLASETIKKFIESEHFKLLAGGYDVDPILEQETFSRFQSINPIRGDYSGEFFNGNFFKKTINVKKPVNMSMKVYLGNNTSKKLKQVRRFTIGGSSKSSYYESSDGRRTTTTTSQEVNTTKDLSDLPKDHIIQINGSCEEKHFLYSIYYQEYAINCDSQILKSED